MELPSRTGSVPEMRNRLIAECRRDGQFASPPESRLAPFRRARSWKYVDGARPAALRSYLDLLPPELLDDYLSEDDLMNVELALIAENEDEGWMTPSDEEVVCPLPADWEPRKKPPSVKLGTRLRPDTRPALQREPARPRYSEGKMLKKARATRRAARRARQARRHWRQ